MPPRRFLCLVGALVAAAIAAVLQLRTVHDLLYALFFIISVPLMVWFLFPGDGNEG